MEENASNPVQQNLTQSYPDNVNNSVPNTPPSSGKKAVKIVGIIIAVIIFIVIIAYFFPRSSQNNNNQTSYNQTPTPSIDYEKEAKTLLKSFSTNNVNSAIIPSTNDILAQQDNINKDTFNLSWTSKKGTSSATLAISSDKNMSYIYLNIIDIADSKTNLNTQTAPQISSNFFSVNPKGEWKCAPLYEYVYCENFWQENENTKKGISISGPITISSNQTAISVSMCQFNKTATDLYANNSCTIEFAKDGIK